MERISSRSNEKIKLCRKLLSSKKERRENGLFPVEGVRIVSDALSENAEIFCAFVTDELIEKYPDTVSLLDEKSGGKVYIVTDELAAYISDTEETQGVTALCRSPSLPSAGELVSPSGKYIMLSRIQDPGNMGTMLRTADAVGIDGVICCGCCDIFNPKTVRSAMGSILRVPLCVCTEDEAFAAFEANGIRSYAAVIDSDALSVTECGFGKGCAVLIGNEGSGLSEETSSRCTERMTIKMHGRINSLNAAMAAGIIMWELSGRGECADG